MWQLSLTAKANRTKSGNQVFIKRFQQQDKRQFGTRSKLSLALRKQQKNYGAPRKPNKKMIYSPCAPATLSSDFDDACEEYISSLLEPFPVTVKRTSHFGIGLFASRDIEPMASGGSEVMLENPAFPLTQKVADRLEAVVDRTAPPVAVGSNSFTVAAMVEETLASTQYPCKPSEYLPIRCLGWLPKESATVDLAFQMIGKAYQLPSSVWTEEECRLLHNKVATNKIDNELYIAASMFNHSCDYNVVWSPSDPLRKLIATKRIKRGEQLFIAYNNETNPMKRHAFLLERFGFHCTCSICKKAGLASLA